MKIIHFITGIDRSLGGVSMYMKLLSKELGKKVELIVVTRPTKNPVQLENCKIIYLPFPLSQIILFQNEWRKILKTEKPDIVHINGIWMIQTWIIQKEALKLGIKTLITPHGMLEPWILNRNRIKKEIALFLYQRKAIKKASMLITTANSEKENILKLNLNNNITNIPNGVDISTIKLKDNWTKNNKILYMSRIHVKKGIELLLETIKTICSDLTNYELIIAGEGELNYVNYLKDIAKSIPNISIKFVGGVYGNEKWRLYQECDFFILPTFSENFGYVIAESLASGTPVITTKGAPWEDIEIYHCGYWIDRDIFSLSNAIKKMISLEKEDLKLMGIQGRKLIEEKYSTYNVANTLLNVYKSL